MMIMDMKFLTNILCELNYKTHITEKCKKSSSKSINIFYAFIANVGFLNKKNNYRNDY